MENKIKKIIAKEGLILLGCILGGIAVMVIGRLIYHVIYLFTKPSLYDDLLIFEPFHSIKNLGLLIAIFGYPLYLFVKFVRWAIKTLKK